MKYFEEVTSSYSYIYPFLSYLEKDVHVKPFTQTAFDNAELRGVFGQVHVGLAEPLVFAYGSINDLIESNEKLSYETTYESKLTNHLTVSYIDSLTKEVSDSISSFDKDLVTASEAQLKSFDAYRDERKEISKAEQKEFGDRMKDVDSSLKEINSSIDNFKDAHEKEMSAFKTAHESQMKSLNSNLDKNFEHIGKLVGGQYANDDCAIFEIAMRMYTNNLPLAIGKYSPQEISKNSIRAAEIFWDHFKPRHGNLIKR